MLDDETTVRGKFVALRPVMDERLTRLWAGAEADALGEGGIAIVERATGLSRTTIRAGRDELRGGVTADANSIAWAYCRAVFVPRPPLWRFALI